MKKTLREKVLTKIAVGADDECWPWIGGYKSFGYGYLRVQDFSEKGWYDIPAHRAAYMIFHGEVPLGLYVLHSCDNRGCCNPKHLRVGTIQENSRDMMNRGRGNIVPRLNIEQVREIRRKRLLGVSLNELAKEYGVSISTISGIAHHYCWKNID